MPIPQALYPKRSVNNKEIEKGIKNDIGRFSEPEIKEASLEVKKTMENGKGQSASLSSVYQVRDS